MRGLRRQHVVAASGTCAAGAAKPLNPGQIVIDRAAGLPADDGRVVAARGGNAGTGRAAKNERRTVVQPKMDFSDIPELSAEQLRTIRRVGCPSIGSEARQLIAIRVDPEVLNRFRAEAKRLKVGYQTLIHGLLAAHVGVRVA